MEDMLRSSCLAALALVLLSCNGESPTEPLALSAEAASPAARRRGSVNRPRELPAACATPARLALSPCPAPGYIVMFKDGTNVAARTEELARRHGFKPQTIYTIIPAFYAVISVETMTALRCEPDIDFIEENAYGGIPTVPLPCSQ